MKMNRAIAAVVFAAGALTVLGFAGTALAGGSGDARPQAAAATPSPDASADDSATVDPSPGSDDDPADDSATFDPSPRSSFRSSGSDDDPSARSSFRSSGSDDDPSARSSFRSSGSDDDPSASPTVSASPSSSSSPVPGTITLTAAQARIIALRAAGGGRVESIERETEHGRLVWDIDVIRNGVEHDIDVDATTGEVTRHRGGDSKSDDHGHHGDDD